MLKKEERTTLSPENEEDVSMKDDKIEWTRKYLKIDDFYFKVLLRRRHISRTSVLVDSGKTQKN